MMDADCEVSGEVVLELINDVKEFQQVVPKVVWRLQIKKAVKKVGV